MAGIFGNTERAVYEIRYSVWKNVAVFILCLGLDLAALLVLLSPSHRDWPSVAGALFFGAGAALFGFRAFGRRIKIYADSQGIQDFRNRYGAIAWSEIGSVTTRTVKGITYLTLYFRNSAKWLQRSPSWTQWIVTKTKMKMSATISLQNTDVDERQFVRFVDARVAVASANG
ncbi:STM3941 family protein [Dyella amyloliquefaciens]|uniref:STM3941 family protein n=1 Tax=Dyella amyloliquefaciens TaxID=1770545 RepID=UPI00102E38E4|nr:STM3941 family protein [Dyella amyloliquefaciens]